MAGSTGVEGYSRRFPGPFPGYRRIAPDPNSRGQMNQKRCSTKDLTVALAIDDIDSHFCMKP